MRVSFRCLAVLPVCFAFAVVLASEPALAAAPGSMLFPVIDDLWLWRGFDYVLGLVSPTLVAGFLLGLLAGELGRVGLKASQNALKATVAFSNEAARYGAIAALLACVVYFL